jgi:hypothetical protein
VAYDLGDLVPLRVNIKDANGTAANASNVTATITAPDGTTTSTTISPTVTGQYDYTYTPTLVGRHLVRWLATGTNASAYTDSFEVNDPTETFIVSLADVKRYLNITSTASDDELRQFILEATDIAEPLVNQKLRRDSFSEKYTATEDSIMLIKQPVVSVTSIVENGVTLTENVDFYVNYRAGLVYRGDTTMRRFWRSGQNNITVNYVAGKTDPSPVEQLLIKEIVRHLWRTQRGASPMAMGSGDSDFIPGSSNIVTYRIQELANLISVPGFA